jgi:hypothetical protein
MVFMIHNRLHRERGFMLLLGVTSTLALATPGERGSSPGGQLMQRVLIVRRNPPTQLEDLGEE